MKTSKLMGIVCLAVLVGCGQEPSAPTSPPTAAPKPTKDHQPLPALANEATPDAGTPPSAPPEAPPGSEQNPATPVVNPVGASDLQRIETAIKAYGREFGARPNTIEDLIKGGFLLPPPKPPEGKKFFLDPQTLKVSLVNK